MEVFEHYLRATPAIDCDNPSVVEFIEKNVDLSGDVCDEAISLYYAVRDLIRYDPYRLDLSIDGLKASATLTKGFGWCVPKAVLLAACCRVRRIPARLGFGDVRNHVSTSRLRDLMQTDVFYWHGYTDIWLDNRWVKATPAFNLGLCQKFGIHPLEFDGKNDSIFHPYDMAGNRHMEYINKRGAFADLPLDDILRTFRRHYGSLLSETAGDFAEEALVETGRDNLHT